MINVIVVEIKNYKILTIHKHNRVPNAIIIIVSISRMIISDGVREFYYTL